MRVFFIAGLCFMTAGALAAATHSAPTGKKRAGSAGPKAGLKTPGIQIPFENLKAEAEIPIETPGWITTGDTIFVSSRSKDMLVRIEARSNKVVEPVMDLKKPCSGSVIAFGSLWIPSCGTQALTKYDMKAGKISGSFMPGVADVLIGVAATADSIWTLTDSKTTLSRVDPMQNQVVGEIRLPAACNSVSFGEGSLWVTCPSDSHLLRINPETNLVEKRIEVSAGARSVAFGDKSVWVLCEKQGKVERIDPKANKVIKTLELNVPNAGGNLAFGGGYLWVTQTGFPLTRIETETDKERVAQQFWGEGGGLISVTPTAIWLSNVEKGSVWRIDQKRVLATLPE